jgi:hypothetical protein
MKFSARPKCLHCKVFYIPDRRNLRHQRYCSQPDCQKESKRQSQRRWLAGEGNQNYFSGSENSRRVREWRVAHPGYSRKKTPGAEEPLQEVCPAQSPRPQDVAVTVKSHALQDVFTMQAALVVGLISTMTGSVLQEDITAASRLLIRKGQDILGSVPTAGSPWDCSAYDDNKTPPLSRAAAARAAPV